MARVYVALAILFIFVLFVVGLFVKSRPTAAITAVVLFVIGIFVTSAPEVREDEIESIRWGTSFDRILVICALQGGLLSFACTGWMRWLFVAVTLLIVFAAVFVAKRRALVRKWQRHFLEKVRLSKR
jgi:uncharacterized membrane protein YoaK (UPF0700 family)